jgi:hypothetical protein
MEGVERGGRGFDLSSQTDRYTSSVCDVCLLLVNWKLTLYSQSVDVVAQWGMWWLSWGCGGSVGDVVAQLGMWWLRGDVVAQLSKTTG